MKVVIADTSPLNYLILVDAINILPRLYERVTIPDVVLGELTDRDAPREVARWAATLPEWIDVLPAPFSEEPSLQGLDPGESAAILLAQRQRESVTSDRRRIRANGSGKARDPDYRNARRTPSGISPGIDCAARSPGSSDGHQFPSLKSVGRRTPLRIRGETGQAR